MKMRRFDEGLAFYIHNQLAGWPIHTCQELYKGAAIRRAYVMSKKESLIFGMVVTGTLFLNLNPFSVQFDSDATYWDPPDLLSN